MLIARELQKRTPQEKEKTLQSIDLQMSAI
jgi:hypothetical protein